MMTLKQKLDRVWQMKPCACPSHRCRWNLEGEGWHYGFWVVLGYVDNIWVTPGKLTFPKYFMQGRRRTKKEMLAARAIKYMVQPWKKTWKGL